MAIAFGIGMILGFLIGISAAALCVITRGKADLPDTFFDELDEARQRRLR